MASSSTLMDWRRGGDLMDEEDEGSDQNTEELECFDDFTVASSWERLISDIEALCRLWMADGLVNLKDDVQNGKPMEVA